MTKHNFKTGDRVRRINHDNNEKMTVGTEWTVSGQYQTTYSDWLEFAEGGDGNAENFELVVATKKPHPNLKANFSIPREILTEAAEAYVKDVYGVTLATAKLPYGTAMVPLHAEIKAA
ncbi:hypothetical protein [Brucella pseudogrignonensis]|uniref:hypothetical protein n=1 Tax=Brucella pseudogrignonensis TaxID=419475 RepID=UPI000CFE0D1D|nr:hypothetical protein [Brucella pseudogrignonensis]MQP38732.1 hypothetical protein [Ochrobactrum sp. MYb237]PQZ43347.1 hypothetical protein CQ059_05290 [Brucella pseudogrignonensis]PRA43094.1 hypothetical protein CQ063_01775 [Brucella pseudogrignonensis]PRA72436.1 hypothetical protein CQ055_03805 [Brucella pseudogrignonensis]